jgi:hypothetical protein
VDLTDVPAPDVRPLLTEERADLLAMLASLGGADWVMAASLGWKEMTAWSGRCWLAVASSCDRRRVLCTTRGVLG